MFLSARCWLPGLFSLTLPLAGSAQGAPAPDRRVAKGRDLPTLARTSFHVGPSVGLNGANVRGVETGGPRATTIEARAGFEAGVAGHWARGGHWALQAAARYTRLGYTQRDQVLVANGGPRVAARMDYRFNYLTVPVSVAYTQFANGQGAQAYAGLYAAQFLAGRFEIDDLAPGYPRVRGPVQAAAARPLFGQGNYVRPWDAGLQAGLGYRYGPVLLQAEYAHGLRTLAPAVIQSRGSNFTRTPYYNRAVRLSLTYFAFGPRD